MQADASSEAQTANAKLGLALSGGGFRASIFHLGVLARLAELGLLRQVEVLSTVSGGSIVGAFYYLHARQLLQDNDLESPELSLEQIDELYVETVQRVVSEFRAVVQKNPRAHILLNPWKNLRMAIPGFRFQHFGLNFGVPYYSRTDRMGDLLDRFLYKKAWGAKRARRRWFPLVEQQIQLQEIKIQPQGATAKFDPKTENLNRLKAKVPILLLNATTLNTGHNWRFEAIGMGEPLPEDKLTRAVFNDVQGQLLAEGYFEGDHHLADRQQEFPFAKAVAASAAVPGIFHPLSITGMYLGWRPQLVDGGLHDNQGVQGLLDKACTHMIISDASSQMPDIHKPEKRIPSVLFRSMSVYGSRVREEELARAEERAQWKPPIGQHDVSAAVLLHLRKGLAPRPVAPVDQQAHEVPLSKEEWPPQQDTTHCFGVDPGLQLDLAEVRTDLDVFSDAEFYSLMYDGYSQADRFLSSVPIVGTGDNPCWDNRGEATRRKFAQFLSPHSKACDPAEWGEQMVAIEQLIRLGAKASAPYGRVMKASGQRFLRFLPSLLPAVVMTVLRGAVVAALIGGATAALVIWHDPLGDGLRTHWPIWWMALGLGGPLLILVLYIQTTALLPLRLASTALLTLVGIVIAVPAVFLSLLMLAETPLLLRLGRLQSK